MASAFPHTPLSLLSQLEKLDDTLSWQISWKRFLELYHAPLCAVAHACYRHHTNGQVPNSEFIEDAVANVVTEFFTRSLARYDPQKGRFRTYLRMMTNARVVDLLRKERVLDNRKPARPQRESAPEESAHEIEIFHRALLATLVEDLRHQIPLRQFEIFELVKLKHLSPEAVADDLGVKRAVIDREIYKAMTKLRELAQQREYKEEFYS